MCADNAKTEDRRDFYLDRIKALELENKKLKTIVTEIGECFYGQNMSVANWHLNGDLEPMDVFFEENNWFVDG